MLCTLPPSSHLAAVSLSDNCVPVSQSVCSCNLCCVQQWPEGARVVVVTVQMCQREAVQRSLDTKVCTCRENHGGGGLVPSTTSGVLGCICYRHGGTTAQRAGQTGSWELRISVTGVDGHLCLSSVGHPPRSAYRTLRPGHRGLSSSFRQKWVLLCRSRLAYSVPWPQPFVGGWVCSPSD